MRADPQSRPTSALLSDLLRHLSGLLRGEIALARDELKANIHAAGIGIGLIVAAVVVAICALNLLTAALVAAIAELGVTPGWAAFGVGTTLALVAIGLGLKGASAIKLSNLAPHQTMQNVRRDAHSFKEIVTNDKSE